MCFTVIIYGSPFNTSLLGCKNRSQCVQSCACAGHAAPPLTFSSRRHRRDFDGAPPIVCLKFVSFTLVFSFYHIFIAYRLFIFTVWVWLFDNLHGYWLYSRVSCVHHITVELPTQLFQQHGLHMQCCLVNCQDARTNFITMARTYRVVRVLAHPANAHVSSPLLACRAS